MSKLKISFCVGALTVAVATVFTTLSLSAQCVPGINRSCENPQAAVAKRERIRNNIHTNAGDPDFQKYCASTLATYRPRRGFAPFVLHEYSPFNGVRVLYTNGWKRVSTGRLYFKTLLALLENDDIHYQLLVVNCFMPRSMTAFSRIKLNPEIHGEGTDINDDIRYEKIIGDGVVIDIAGNIDVMNHDALVVTLEIFMQDRQPDTQLWFDFDPPIMPMSDY